MKKQWKLLATIQRIVLAAALLPGQGVASRAEQPQREQPTPTGQVKALAVLPADASRRAKRLEISRIYNTPADWDLTDLKKGQRTPGGMILHHAAQPLAGQVASADLVVVGKCLNVQPHVSEDKTALYTEIELQVEEILHPTGGDRVRRDPHVIRLVRPGGVAALPSGEVIKNGIWGYEDVADGERLVAFVRVLKGLPVYSVNRLYELSGGKVLQKETMIRIDDEGSTFEGWAEDAFLQEIRAIAGEGGKK